MPAYEPYEPPTITVLGTLRDLTLGTGSGAADAGLAGVEPLISVPDIVG